MKENILTSEPCWVELREFAVGVTPDLEGRTY